MKEEMFSLKSPEIETSVSVTRTWGKFVSQYSCLKKFYIVYNCLKKFYIVNNCLKSFILLIIV